jgi:hypothetical protein
MKIIGCVEDYFEICSNTYQTKRDAYGLSILKMNGKYKEKLIRKDWWKNLISMVFI